MSSAYFKNGSLIESFTSTATAAGTTTLVASSDAYQIFTGSATQTMVLPNATTLILNQKFEVVNTSTGAIAVQTNGGASLASVAAGATKIFRVTDISSAPGVWDSTTAASGGAGGLSTAESGQFNALAAGGFSAQSRVLKFNPEEIAGNYWTVGAPTIVAHSRATMQSINGYAYLSAGTDTSGSNPIANSERFSDDSNYWLARTGVGTPRSFVTGFTSPSNIYVIAGATNSAYTTFTGAIQSYSDITDTWTSLTSHPVAHNRSAGAYVNGFGYVYGGLTGSVYSTGVSTNNLFHPTANAWYLRAPISAARGSIGQFIDDGFIYAVAGVDSGSNSVAILQKFSDSLNSWSTEPSLPQVSNGPYTCSGLGTGIATGGFGTVSYLVNQQIYNFQQRLWESKASLPLGTQGFHQATMLNGVEFAAGGDTNFNTAITVNSKYTPTTIFSLGSLKKSTAVPTSLSIAVILNALAPNVPVQLRTDGNSWKSFMSGGSALKLGETLSAKFVEYPNLTAAGGYNGSDVLTTETYNVASNVWQVRANAPVGGSGFCAFPMAGTQFFLGGTGSSGSIPTSFRTFTDLTNTWVNKTAVGFSSSGTGVRHNGFGYCVGAANNSTNTYKYSPTSDTWAASASLAVAGRGPALSDIGGRIYGVGGTISSGVGHPTTQYYSDTTNVWTALGAGSNSTDTSQSGGTYDGCSFSINNSAFHGGNGSGSLYFERFNVSTLIWSTRANLLSSTYVSAASGVGGIGYVAHGYNTGFTTAASSYNPDANTWASIASLSVARVFTGGSAQSGTSAYRSYEVRVGVPAFYAGLGGFVWVAKTSMSLSYGTGLDSFRMPLEGDLLNPRTNTSNERYLTLLDTWVNKTAATAVRSSNGGFSLQGIGYRAAGYNGSNIFTVDGYNPVTNAWANYANTTNLHYSGNGGSLNGFGIIENDNSGGTVSTERYNPSTNAWSAAAQVSATASGGSAAESAGGFYYKIGGSSSKTTMRQYNDAANTWATQATIPSLLYLGGSFTLGGMVYAYGADASISAVSQVVQFYNPASNSWNITSPLIASSFDQGGGCHGHLGGGSGLLSGYFNNSSWLSTVNQFVPSVKQAVLSAGLTVS